MPQGLVIQMLRATGHLSQEPSGGNDESRRCEVARGSGKHVPLITGTRITNYGETDRTHDFYYCYHVGSSPTAAFTKATSKSWPFMSLHIACRRQTLASFYITRWFIEVDIELQDQSKLKLDADCTPGHLVSPGRPQPNSLQSQISL